MIKNKNASTKHTMLHKLVNRFTLTRIIVFLIICIVAISVCLGFKHQIENLLNKTTTISNKIDKNGLTTYFVDVGQGDGIAIRFPDGKTMLVDAGPQSSANKFVRYLKNNFFERGEDTFDYLLLTHSDEDHCGGMVKVCEEFKINKIFRPNIYSKYPEKGTPIFDETNGNSTNKTVETTLAYYNAITAFNNETSNIIVTNIDLLNSTEKIQGDGYSIDFYYPTKDYISSSDVGSVGSIENNYSPIMVLNYNGKKIMLTGDISTTGEALALNNGLPDIDVLKVAHHGSSTSTGTDFLIATTPEHAIISCGKNNSYGHPTTELINRLTVAGAEIYRTDTNGHIVVNITTQETENINIYFDKTNGTIYIQAEYIMAGVIILSIYFCFGIKAKNIQKN